MSWWEVSKIREYFSETVNEMIDEMVSDNFRGTLPRLIAVELSVRLKNEIMSRVPSI